MFLVIYLVCTFKTGSMLKEGAPHPRPAYSHTVNTIGQAMWLKRPQMSLKGSRKTHGTHCHVGFAEGCSTWVALVAEDLAWNPVPDTLKLCDWTAYKLLWASISSSVLWRQYLYLRLEWTNENSFMQDVLYSIFIKPMKSKWLLFPPYRWGSRGSGNWNDLLKVT